MDPGPHVDAYSTTVRDAAVGTLGAAAVGVHTTGSLALDAFAPARSDTDVLVVASDGTPASDVRTFADAVTHVLLHCPVTGLELAVVQRSATSSVVPAAGYLMEVNTGPELPPLLDFAPDRPAHWCLVDRAVCRQSGIALHGPAPADLIASVRRADSLTALAQ